MKPFHTIAIPHDDILQGRLTLDVFAADLWEVYHGRGPEEYRDPDLFFQKTYLTAGLRNLFEVVEKRLQGQGGDPVIQMQTPFGGGKTHSLIALYHKAREWGANTVVISGTPLTGKETLWGLMAGQLTGSRAGFEDPVAPGRDAIRQLLAAHQPALVLMDEVLEYVTKAAGVAVGQSTLAAQTLAFMQELTEAAATLEKTVLVVTLPSSTLEHYDEQAVRLFEQLKKISGRVEKIFTPVQDDEVGAIIRRRLFASVDDQAAAQVINAFVEQAEQEALLPRGEETAAYRERFRQTYPFLPEVVDVLYHRWGSFPSFQRTRGTLRLLALVVGSLKQSGQPTISLADFDLSNSDIRRELLNHIGNEYDSVLAADITSPEAGARKANLEIGKAYQGLRLGERVATTIFMYSHLGGGGEAGATTGEVKRQNLRGNLPASVVAEVLQKLSGRHLF
ncbi:MAG: ATP-binding protein, partial [Caldilineae bacterium]